jgi:DNA ligase-1
VRRFAALFAALDGTRSTERKVEALEDYFRGAPPEDAAWALFLLTGRRLKRLIPARALGDWTLHVTGLPAWQLEASIVAAGDVAEAIALLVDAARDVAAPSDEGPGEPLSSWIERVRGLAGLAPEAQREAVAAWWRDLREDELLLFVKLLTGELRVGVSRTLVEKALARLTGLDRATIAHRLTGPWEPTAAFMSRLVSRDASDADPSRPFPFMLASPLEAPTPDAPDAGLGPVDGWLLEWKWDGIRAQVVRRDGRVWIWSRGEELVTDRFPEVRGAAEALPEGTVLDGELLALRGDRPLPFALLQRRIGRTRLTQQVKAEAPVALLAFDALEDAGHDLRQAPLSERRARLDALLAALPVDAAAWLRPSPIVAAPTWAEAAAARAGARERGVEGLMLKRRSSPWRPGRHRGDWWKWKLDPYAFDAVLVAAEPGSGRRASLYTAYTFAVWDDDQEPHELVTVARAYSGLDDEELKRFDRWIRRHTVEQFGPVRTVEPVHVFELHCEGVQRSPRHKAGLAVRFPRIARWRSDKRPADADSLRRLRTLVPPEPPPPRPEDVPGGQLTLFEP